MDPSWVDGTKGGIPPSHRLLVAIIRRAVWDFVLYKDVRKKDDPALYGIGVDAAGWLFTIFTLPPVLAAVLIRRMLAPPPSATE